MKKRNAGRALAVLMSLCLALGGMSLTALAAKKYKAEAISKVNIRSGPSSRADKVGQMTVGEECILVAVVKKGRTVGDFTADMDFYKLSDGNYVAAKFIKWTDEINDDEDDSDADSSSDAEDSGEDVSDVDDSDTDDTSGDEEGVEIEDGLMEVGGGSSDDDADEAESADDEDDSDEEETPAEKTVKVVTGTVNTSALNVRTKPSSSSTVVKKLKKGEKVTLSEAIKDGSSYSGSKVSGNWYKLQTGGFVAANYLNVSTSETTVSASSNDSSKPAATVATGTATAEATMYETADTSSAKKGTMKKGDSKVVKSSHADGTEVDGETISGNWYRLDNGYYVQAKYIRVTKNAGGSGGASATATGVSEGATVKAIKNVNIRKSASASASKIGLFSAGKTDTVTAVSGSWVKLKNAGGFVSADYITVVSSGAESGSSTSSDDSDVPTEDDDIPVE